MPSLNRRMSSRKLVLLSLMIALSMGLHAIEYTMPFIIPIPGVKLGLANIVTVICLYIFNRWDTFRVVGLRVLLVGIVVGSLFTPSFWISSGGAIFSFGIMALAYRLPKITPISISLLGAVFHNIGQLIIVTIIMGTNAVLYYLPWLLIWAIPMGLLTGFSAKLAIKALRNSGLNDTM